MQIPHLKQTARRRVTSLTVAGAMLLVAAAGGCTSVSSTMLNRLESDDFVGNSNGTAGKHCQTRPYKGVPITLRVPTHVDLAIEEKVWFSLDRELGEIHRLVTQSEHRHLSVNPKLVYTDKVFTVDINRPAAGSADYTLEFGDGTEPFDNRQYFASLKSRVVDETIEDVTTAIETVFGAVAATPASTLAPEPSDSVIFFEQNRTVAWKRFDLDAPDFEWQLKAFVQQHVNDCHRCAESVSFDQSGWHETQMVEEGIR